MHIYQPYEVIADTEDCLHLKETEARERYYFTVFRVLPVFLLFFLWFVLQQVGTLLPMGWNYSIAGVCIIIAGKLLLKTYIPEIKILRSREVFLLQKTFNGTKERTIQAADIAGITLKSNNRRKQNVVFVLRTIAGKSYELLIITKPYTDDNHTRLIRERLEDLLQLQVQQA